MRGSPLLRALLVFLALLALAPLLWQMTREAPAQAPAPAAKTESGPQAVQLTLAFTTLPKRVDILHLNQVVWTRNQPAQDEELSLELPWPKEGVELVFKVEWPADAPLSAMRVKLTDPNDTKMERSLWGRGAVEKVIGFP